MWYAVNLCGAVKCVISLWTKRVVLFSLFYTITILFPRLNTLKRSVSTLFGSAHNANQKTLAVGIVVKTTKRGAGQVNRKLLTILDSTIATVAVAGQRGDGSSNAVGKQ